MSRAVRLGSKLPACGMDSLLYRWMASRERSRAGAANFARALGLTREHQWKGPPTRLHLKLFIGMGRHPGFVVEAAATASGTEPVKLVMTRSDGAARERTYRRPTALVRRPTPSRELYP